MIERYVQTRQVDSQGGVNPPGACRHYWVIESPEGAVSIGVCKVCGVHKKFKNSVRDSWWVHSDAVVFRFGIDLAHRSDIREVKKSDYIRKSEYGRRGRRRSSWWGAIKR